MHKYMVILNKGITIKFHGYKFILNQSIIYKVNICCILHKCLHSVYIYDDHNFASVILCMDHIMSMFGKGHPSSNLTCKWNFQFVLFWNFHNEMSKLCKLMYMYKMWPMDMSYVY